MKRLDLALVELNLAPSRTKAQRLIEAGEVEILTASQWKIIDLPSFQIKEPTLAMIRLNLGAQTLKYVSRGGLKLEAALDRLQLSVQALRCLDVGLSTGGFTDCLLQRGATEIFGVDVGHGQVAASLKTEARLQIFEGVHVRDLPQHPAFRQWLKVGVDLCVVDVSFISLLQVLPPLSAVLPAKTLLLALVKPQFEVGARNLDKHGVVRDPTLFVDVETQVLQAVAKCGFSSMDYFACEVKGQDGNQEFFIFARRT